MTEERRAHFRKIIEIQAWIADTMGDHWTEVRLLDISLGGVAFMSPQAIAIDQLRMFRCQLPGPYGEKMQLTVNTRHCVENPLFKTFRIGAAFVRLNEKNTAIITRFLEAGHDNQ